MAEQVVVNLAAEALDTDASDKEQLLLDACERGDYKYVEKYLKREGATACNIESSGLKQTPLHIAADNGHVQIVKLLLSYKADPMKLDLQRQTPFMCACCHGHIKVVQFLLEEVPQLKHSLNDLDKFKRTSLLMAASSGHVKVVKLLLNREADATIQDRYQRTAMRCACINGHAEVVEEMLKHGMDKSPVVYEIINKEKQRETVNVLMDAINRAHDDVAMAIIESRQVKESLEYTTEIDGKETTPMRLLFKKMPEVAERALNYFTTRPTPQDSGNDSKKRCVSFKYEFLDDFSVNRRRNVESAPPDESTPLMTNVSSSSELPLTASASSSWRPLKRDRANHCLEVLINSKSKILVRHPAVTTLLFRKWDRFARNFFILALLLHAVYAILMTTFTLITLQPKSLVCLQVFNTSHKYDGNCEIDHFGQPLAIGVVGALIILIAACRLLFEGFRLAVLRLDYFWDLVNYIEGAEFVGAILFVFVFSTECFCPSSWQWQIGAGCVFLAWIDLLMFIRLFPIFGIFVVMFLKIVKNFAKVSTFLAIFLVLSFTFPFYMIFHEPLLSPDIRSPFKNPAKAFVKTLTMLTGGVSFDSLFKLDGTSTEGVQYAIISYPLIILFIVVMTILLNNLLTGLAVGDVKEVRADAKISTLSLWVKFILLTEELVSVLPIFGEKIQREPENHIEDLDKYPNELTNWFWYRALEFSHFDEYDTKLINPDAIKSNQKMMKKLDDVMTKLEKVEDKLNELQLHHTNYDDD